MFGVNSATASSRGVSSLLVPVAAGDQLRHHHPVSPGLQVPLSGHLAAGRVLVHLPDTLHLAAAAQTHVGRRLHLSSVVHRHCNRGGMSEQRFSVSAFSAKRITSVDRCTGCRNPIRRWRRSGTSAWCAGGRGRGGALGPGLLPLWSHSRPRSGPGPRCLGCRLVEPVLLLLEVADGLVQQAAAPHCHRLVLCSLLADHLLHHLTIA